MHLTVRDLEQGRVPLSQDAIEPANCLRERKLKLLLYVCASNRAEVWLEMETQTSPSTTIHQFKLFKQTTIDKVM